MMVKRKRHMRSTKPLLAGHPLRTIVDRACGTGSWGHSRFVVYVDYVLECGHKVQFEAGPGKAQDELMQRKRTRCEHCPKVVA